MVVAVDDFGFPDQGPEQRQGRLDALHHHFVQRTAQPHQALAAGLAMDDQLADQ